MEADRPHALKSTIQSVLRDEQRSGKPSNFTDEEEDLVTHIRNVVATDPQARFIFVMDRLNTHKSEQLVLFVTAQCGIDPETLGKKGKAGVLAPMEARKAFLTDPAHRIRIVYTPKHPSWSNQIECWFSILVRRLLNKRSSFGSVEALEKRIAEFIEYYNKHLAKPFRWTYEGKLLKV